MIGIYNAALVPVRALVEAWAAWQGLRPERRKEWAQRRGRGLPALSADTIWFHGASAGEARLASSLVRAYRRHDPDRPLAVSAITPAGRQLLPEPPEVVASFFAPLDFRAFHRRFFASGRPALLALLETELWPNLLSEARRAGVPAVVLNGRLSEARMIHYRRMGRLYRPLLVGLARVGAQSQADADRFVDLGLPSSAVDVTGNIKYDVPVPEGDAGEWRRRLGLAESRPVLVAGSTGPGEEPLVLEAFRSARRDVPELFLILAPRHTRRVSEVEQLIRGAGLTLTRLSAPADAETGRRDVLLVDTIGELAGLYPLASSAFVGGSLVPIGGHNVLEPAATGVPVLFGPHTENFAEPVDILLRHGGAVRVADAVELGTTVARMASDEPLRRETGRRAREVLDRNRGALDRSVVLIEAVLRRTPSSDTA